MHLKHLSNDQLHRKNVSLAEEERRLSLEVLHHFRETERRRLYAELGYSSLWEYATQYLKYSEGAAGRRIRAMKLLKDLPEIEEKIESGTLNLTTACQVQAFLKHENYTREEKLELVEKLENKSIRDVQRELVKLNPEAAPKERIREIADDKVELRLVLTHQQIEKLDKLKALRSHKNPAMTYNELIDDLLDLSLKKLEPKTVTPSESPIGNPPPAMKSEIALHHESS